MFAVLARLGLVPVAIFGVMTVSGCEGSLDIGAGGSAASALAAQKAQIEAQDFHVVSLGTERAVVSAKGRQVAIEPANGFCLARDSVETSDLSAFALIGDCALDKAPDKSKRGARGELKMPRGVPGIITVSVSGNPKLEEAGGLKGMEAFLKTPAGREMLGRGDDPFAVKVKETRQIDNGIYVLVEDDGQGVLPVLSKRFWRGFVQVNDRLAVVTVSGFRARPLGKDQMLEYLVDQVKTLAVANAQPINEPLQIQVAQRGTVEDGAVAQNDLRTEPLAFAATRPAGPLKAPQPAKRPLPATPSVQIAAVAPVTATEAAKPADVPAIKTATAFAPALPETSTLVASLPPSGAAQPQSDPAKPVAQGFATAPAKAPAQPQAKAEVKVTAKPAPAKPVATAEVVKAVKAAKAGATAKPKRPAKPQRKLATAAQAVKPPARPSSAKKSKAATTRLAPANAPSAPKRPRV